eukprot:m51a1_g9166 hypothetical protein (486) ;mRNA; f:13411-15043
MSQFDALAVDAADCWQPSTRARAWPECYAAATLVSSATPLQRVRVAVGDSLDVGEGCPSVVYNVRCGVPPSASSRVLELVLFSSDCSLYSVCVHPREVLSVRPVQAPPAFRHWLASHSRVPAELLRWGSLEEAQKAQLRLHWVAVYLSSLRGLPMPAATAEARRASLEAMAPHDAVVPDPFAFNAATAAAPPGPADARAGVPAPVQQKQQREAPAAASANADMAPPAPAQHKAAVAAAAAASRAGGGVVPPAPATAAAPQCKVAAAAVDTEMAPPAHSAPAQKPMAAAAAVVDTEMAPPERLPPRENAQAPWIAQREHAQKPLDDRSPAPMDSAEEHEKAVEVLRRRFPVSSRAHDVLARAASKSADPPAESMRGLATLASIPLSQAESWFASYRRVRAQLRLADPQALAADMRRRLADKLAEIRGTCKEIARAREMEMAVVQQNKVLAATQARHTRALRDLEIARAQNEEAQRRLDEAQCRQYS